MLNIGCHLSNSKGYMNMCSEAASIGANTFQFFTRNPRGGAAKDIDPEDVKEALSFMSENRFVTILAHAPYTLNPCAARPEVREFTENTMRDDLARMEYTPGNLYNFHPGSHVGQGIETGIAMIADALNAYLTPDLNTTVLLETMAGKGSEVGGAFEELREIIDRVTRKEKLGVCFDTCHVWDAGYDIVNDLDGVLARFDDLIGLDKLRAVHFNDSKNPLGSHKDRHEKLGLGCIGEAALKRIALHPALQGRPFILETPNEDEGYMKEIALVKGWMIGNEE
jgi:deoxyribonuclease-4